MHVRRHRPNNGRLGRGLLASIFLHGQILLALFLFAHFYGKGEQNEVELSFESAKESELPSDLPPIDRPAEPDQPQPNQPVPSKKTPKLAQTEKKPEPEIEIPPPEKLPPIPKPIENPLVQAPPPKPEEPPPPTPPEKLHQKIVELDMGKEVEAPDDAKYLAQKNNRAEEETRARETNLQREQQGGEAHPSDQENKIAGLEDREARPEKRIASPRALPESFQPENPNRVTLSMRSPGSQGAEKIEESRDGMMRAPSQNRHGDDFVPGGRLRLSRKQYESVFGTDAEAAEALARSERSKRKGKFAARQEQVRSALENFVPEVKPGNQTALNTRAAPFAQFITRMHRQIHELWAFGFMTALDSKPSSIPLNNPSLVAKLEIVLDQKGNVDRVNMVRSSGLTVYDAAAIDVVYSAAPYPPPPPAILSGNGKVYVHWTFHRNEEACGTMGVDYFILNNGPKAKEKTTPPS
jgi:TonB family protein